MVATIEERVSRLESSYEHIASSTDIADLRTEFKTDIAEVRTDIAVLNTTMIKWFIGTVLVIVISVSAVVSAVVTAISSLAN